MRPIPGLPMRIPIDHMIIRKAKGYIADQSVNGCGDASTQTCENLRPPRIRKEEK
jgi:hypothetical protein